MWEPLPPSGYRALGTIVVPAAEQPGTNEVLCVREDLCAQSRLFDSAIWKFEPQIMQVRVAYNPQGNRHAVEMPACDTDLGDTC